MDSEPSILTSPDLAAENAALRLQLQKNVVAIREIRSQLNNIRTYGKITIALENVWRYAGKQDAANRRYHQESASA